MGFVREANVFKLVFADPALEGLEVRARSVPLEQFLALTEMADSVQSADGRVSKEDLGAVRGLFTGFAAALVSWNLEEDHGGTIEPVPATEKGVFSQDVEFVLQIILAWMEGIAGVASPLGRGSNGGETFPEASIPMETLSPSLSS